MRDLSSHLRVLVALGALVTLSAVELSAGQGAAASGQPTSRPATVTAADESSAIEVRGHERLAWDQSATSAVDLGGLDFVAYVNGQPQALLSVSCASTEGPAGFECSAALPALGLGHNAVEIAARFDSGARTEGLRSPPILLRFGERTAGISSASGPDAPPVFERSWATADGTRLRATAVAGGLEDSTDLLPLPDGRILIAERSGRVRVFGQDGLLTAAALILEDVTVGEGRGLLALTLDPDFASTRHVFASYTTEQGLRIARFTLSGGRLVDRAVVLDGLPIAAVQPAALLRAGPDGRLYLATDAGGDPDRLFDLGSYSGKVLRLATDGTTPEDQASRSPVWSVGVSHPIGLAWTTERTTLRLIGVEDPESQAARGPSSADFARGLSRLSLPLTLGATRATLGAGASLPAFRDQLFVGSAHERAILRVWFDGDVPVGSEWWLQDLPGPVTALTSAADGTIYAAVGPALLRIVAEP